MTKRIACLVPLVAAAACHTTVSPPPAATTPPTPGSFTVLGTASIDVAPDTADLHLTLSSQAARPGAATRAVRDEETQLVAALAKIGLEPRDLRLCQLRINPVYDVKGEHVIAYASSIDVVASTHDFDKVGAMMEAAADAGATSMTSDFHADLPALKAKVRGMALAAAKDKAKQIADGLGIEPGKVIGVVEDPTEPLSYTTVANDSVSIPGGPAAAPDTLTMSISVTYQLA